MNTNIIFGDLSAVPSDYDCPDGDLDMALNLENNGTGIRNAVMPQTLGGFNDKVVIGQHLVNSSSKNLIFSDFNKKNFFSENVDAPFLTIDADAEFIKFAAIGNTVLILTTAGIFYALYKDGQYKSLGRKMPAIDVRWSLEGCEKHGSLTEFTLPEKVGDFYHLSADNARVFTEYAMAAVNKFVANERGNDRFTQPFIVRAAYRLYDGSLAMHTLPVLMHPVVGMNPRLRVVVVDNSEHKYKVGASGFSAKLYGAFYVNEKELELWSDIITSLDIFVSLPLYNYNQSGTITSMADDGALDDDRAYMALDSSSSLLDTINPNGAATRGDVFHADRVLATTGEVSAMHPSMPSFDDGSTFRNNVSSCANLYLVKSYDITAIPSGGAIVDADNLAALEQHEVMTDDFESGAYLVAKDAYNYNGRINLCGIQKNLSFDVCPENMVHCNTQFQPCNNVPPTSASLGTVTPYLFLKRDGKSYVIKGKPSQSLHAALRVGFLFVPYTDAYMLMLVSSNGNTIKGIKTFNLTRHDFLNGAYFCGNLWSASDFSFDSPTDAAKAWMAKATRYATVDALNRIYTSEVNNPFAFPVANINAIGNGRVIALASAAKAMSQGQFGVFPMYAFTDEGIWALEVSGTTGAFSSKHPLSRDICSDSAGITQLDSAVVFPSERGLMLLEGSTVVCITDILNSDVVFDAASLPAMEKIHALLRHDTSDNCISLKPAKQFFSNAHTIYDYFNQRLIVYAPTPLYGDGNPAYVFSLRSKKWSMLRTDIAYHIDSYPQALAVTSKGALVDFARNNTATPSGMLITRPLKFGDGGVYKTVDDIIVRGNFKPNNVQTVLYGSRDLVTWKPVASSTTNKLRGYSGTPYKFFRILLVTNLGVGESISGVSVSLKPKFNNKLR